MLLSSAHFLVPLSLLISNTNNDKDVELGICDLTSSFSPFFLSPLTCGVQRQLNSTEALDFVAITSVIPYGIEQGPRDHLTGVPE